MMNLNSPFFRLITNIGNLILVSILWIIGCIPIVTIGASTAALYYTCVKVIRHGRGYLFSSFLQSYRSNLKQGIVVTLLGILISFVLYMDFRYITALDAAPQYLVAIYQICMTFFASLLIYLVATMSRFSVSFFQTGRRCCISFFQLLKLSVFMMIRHFYYTIVMLVLLITVIILMMAVPFSVFFLPGIYILLTSLIMEKVLQKYTPHVEDGSDEGSWYLAK